MKPDQRIVLIYLIFGIGWIFFSDQLLNEMLNLETVATLQTLKGVLFVVVTGAVLWSLLQFEGGRRQKERDDFRFLFMNNPQAMLVFSRENRQILEVNDMAIALYGYSRDAFKRLTLFDIRPKSEHERLKQFILERDPKENHVGAWQHQRADGTIFDVDIYIRNIQYQGVIASIVVIRDITEQKQIERERVEMQMQLNSILDSIRDVVWSMDIHTRKLTYISPAALHVFGVDAQSIIVDGYRLRDIIHPDDAEMVGSNRDRQINDKLERLEIDYRIVLPQGGIRWINQVTWGVFVEGVMVRVDGICRDITDQVELESEVNQKKTLMQALEHEKENYKARGHLVSMLSHDFRTPITTISASADMLITYEGRMDTEQRKKHFDRILSNAFALNKQLDDLLQLLRTEASSSQFQPENQDVIVMAQKVVDSVRLVAGSNFAIELCSPATIMAEVDNDLLSRVMDNLLMNAVKYSPKGGRVTVSIEAVDAQLEIIIQDQGMGISEDDIPHLFDPYFRSNRTRHLPGTGLGLPIAHQAIELHGGTISVESHLNEGTIFTVQLPIHREKQAESLPTSSGMA